MLRMSSALAVVLLGWVALAGSPLVAGAGGESTETHSFVMSTGGGADASGESGIHIVMGGDGEHTWVGEEGVHSVGVGHHGLASSSGTKASFLGVQLTDLTAELLTHFGVPQDAGVLVAKVIEGSPAARAGIRVGDILTAVDGEGVGSARALAHAIHSREDGEMVTLQVWRDGSMETLTAALEARESAMVLAKKLIVKGCDEEGDGCDVRLLLGHGAGPGFDCGGVKGCKIEMKCEDGDCTCQVDGETADCSALSLPHHPHHQR